MSATDVSAVVFAVVVHGVIALSINRLPEQQPRPPDIIEVDISEPPPPPPPPPAPEPERKIVTKQKLVEAPPPPNRTPPAEPPKTPPPPIFGVTMESTTDGDADVAVPVGNTTMIDPKKSGTGPVMPLAAAAAPAKPAYKPVSELYIKSLPDVDAVSCGRSVKYPEDAEQNGIEGDVRLRVSLDEAGRVVDVKVISGLGHGLDEAAVYALKHKCKFTPAIATDGKPAAYVIPSYTFHFELPK